VDRIPVGARFSAPVQTGPGAHAASCTRGTGSFPGLKSGRGVTLTPHPLLERLEVYLYSPYGPYGLCRASVPVQRCTLPLPSLYMACMSGHFHILIARPHSAQNYRIICSSLFGLPSLNDILGSTSDIAVMCDTRTQGVPGGIFKVYLPAGRVVQIPFIL